MMKFNNHEVTNIEFEDVDMKDYPKFCDAYISYAEIDGREATEGELEDMQADSGFFYDALTNYIH